MIEAIYKRRSIRRFLPKPVPEEALKEIIHAGLWAPSAKNQQPWKFIAVRGNERRSMVSAMKAGIAKARKEGGPLAGNEEYIPSAVYTARVLELAPVTVFIMNTNGSSLYEDRTTMQKVLDLCDIESISAAIENMVLAAADMGIGSLWTCNIFFAYDELKQWLDTDGEMVAAVAFGYTDREVRAPGHKKVEDVLTFRGNDEK